jgi:hypothetical protein
VRSIDSSCTSNPSLLPPQLSLHLKGIIIIRGRCIFCSRPFPITRTALVPLPCMLPLSGQACSAREHSILQQGKATCQEPACSCTAEPACTEPPAVGQAAGRACMCSCRLCHQTSGKRLSRHKYQPAQVRALEHARSQPGCCYREHRNFVMHCLPDSVRQTDQVIIMDENSCSFLFL